MTASLYGAGAEYALHSLLALAASDEPLSVLDLATYQQLPERFLAKVFSRLKQAGLVTGIEGVAGGFVLARPADRIRVLDVLDAVDPDRHVFACAEIRDRFVLFEGDAPELGHARAVPHPPLHDAGGTGAPRRPGVQDRRRPRRRTGGEGAAVVHHGLGGLVPRPPDTSHRTHRRQAGVHHLTSAPT